MNSGSIKRIDELGRIVIPKDIRKRLSIKTNDSLEVSIENNNIIISKSKSINNLDDFIIKILNILCKNFNYKLGATNRERVIFNNIDKEIDLKKIFANENEEKDFITIPIIIDSNIEGYLIGIDVSIEIIKLVNAIIVNFFDITC